MIFFVQKVAEFKAKRNDKKSSSKKRELSTTVAPLPPKNGFKKFDFHDKFGFDLNDEQVPIRNFTYAVEGALLRWDYKDLLKVVPFNNTAFFDTRYFIIYVIVFSFRNTTLRFVSCFRSNHQMSTEEFGCLLMYLLGSGRTFEFEIEF